MSEDQNSTGSSETEEVSEIGLEPKKLGRPTPQVDPDFETELLDKAVLEYGAGAFELSTDDIKILAIKMKFPKASAASIARSLGISAKQVERTIKKPEFNRQYVSYFRYTADSMKDAARAAAARLLTLVNSPNDHTALSAIRIALGPYIQQAKVHVEIKPNITFRTNVTASGNLVREVVEGEINLIKEAIDADGPSSENDTYSVEEKE